MVGTAGVQDGTSNGTSNGTSLTNRNLNGSVEDKDATLEKNRLNPHVNIFLTISLKKIECTQIYKLTN